MKLSQAIRVGCQMSDGLSEELLIARFEGKPCACALGAAFLAVAGQAKRNKVLKLALYLKTRDEAFDLADTHLSLVFGSVLDEERIPVARRDGGVQMTLVRDAIVHFNDQLRWKREDIADYLERLGF